MGGIRGGAIAVALPRDPVADRRDHILAELGSHEKGSFKYPLAADPARPLTVLVWCERFAVPVAGATFST